MVGSSDVGKTTLMENLIGKIGKVEHNNITIAIDYGSLTINGKKFISLELQDKKDLSL
ncbi:protein of unknown function [Methanocaldococcus lauensis]|nr:protein of unknown function [Methanocaldococcus lauensis]